VSVYFLSAPPSTPSSSWKFKPRQYRGNYGGYVAYVCVLPVVEYCVCFVFFKFIFLPTDWLSFPRPPLTAWNANSWFPVSFSFVTSRCTRQAILFSKLGGHSWGLEIFWHDLSIGLTEFCWILFAVFRFFLLDVVFRPYATPPCNARETLTPHCNISVGFLYDSPQLVCRWLKVRYAVWETLSVCMLLLTPRVCFDTSGRVPFACSVTSVMQFDHWPNKGPPRPDWLLLFDPTHTKATILWG